MHVKCLTRVVTRAYPPPPRARRRHTRTNRVASRPHARGTVPRRQSRIELRLSPSKIGPETLRSEKRPNPVTQDSEPSAPAVVLGFRDTAATPPDG